MQGVTSGIMRGAGKQRIGAICNLVGYYAIGLPIAVSLMFAAKLGIVGEENGTLSLSSQKHKTLKKIKSNPETFSLPAQVSGPDFLFVFYYRRYFSILSCGSSTGRRLLKRLVLIQDRNVSFT